MTTTPARTPAMPRPEFEKPLIPLEEEIRRLEQELEARRKSDNSKGELVRATEADLAAKKAEYLERLDNAYRNLTAWEIVSKVARHPKRPQSTDYLRLMCTDFCQLHGDRRFGDDPAMLTGFARIGPHKVMVIANRKGRDTNERMLCNFGCAHPEGYRKALRTMKLAEKFGLPVVTLVDTPGAYPGIGAEERGQAEAIAVNIREMAALRTPIVSVIIGEGGSGGALAIAVADRVAMLRYSWYSVISPEGCAAILWKKATPETNLLAAEALYLTAENNKKLGVVEDIIEEPVGGAHRDPEMAARNVQRWITGQLRELSEINPDRLVQTRYDRYRNLGVYARETPTAPAAAAPSAGGSGDAASGGNATG